MPEYVKSKLTVAKKRFAHEFAKTDNATKAVKLAYPEISSSEVAAIKGHRLLRNDSVTAEITKQKLEIQKLSNASLKVFSDHLQDGTKPEIRQRTAEFVWEQGHGKATQKFEQRSTVVAINIDLSQNSTPG